MHTYMITYLLIVTFSLFGRDSASEPNILLIITDQQTANAMSFVGNSYLNTPAIDKLASEGIHFENTYAVQPLCKPFRTSLLTGRYPHETGTTTNLKSINGDFPMLGKLVASAGYSCDYIGKWHVGTTHEVAGFKQPYSNVGIDNEKADAAVDYLSKKHDQPFFLTVSFMNPHNVCQLARADAVGTDLPDGPIGLPPTELNELPPLPDNFNVPENEPSIVREMQKASKSHHPTENWNELIWRQYLWGYYRLVEKVDREIGRVLEALKEGGHEDNTIVIFTSDHGEGVAMHHWNQKRILYEQAVRVPLIIRWKGKTEARAYQNMVSNALDIPVTILDLTGVDKPEGMHGISLKPLIDGKSMEGRDYLVCETEFAEGKFNQGAKGRMLRTEHYKYIIYDKGEKREQLFDLGADPGEMNNLAYNKKYKTQLIYHRELLAEWAKKTSDRDFANFIPLSYNLLK